jgi:hypothetical protein
MQLLDLAVSSIRNICLPIIVLAKRANTPSYFSPILSSFELAVNCPGEVLNTEALIAFFGHDSSKALTARIRQYSMK